MNGFRDIGHWQREDFAQRMTTQQWRSLLLREEDRLIFNGRMRRLVGRYIGAGVFEVRKEPLKPEETSK